MSTADAVAREAAWLAAYNVSDGLPALLKSAGGPFDVVQGYRRRTPNTREASLYLRRAHIRDARWASPRKIPSYTFMADLSWPLGTTSTGANIAETEQQAFDNAIELVIRRIRGLLFDHTHGGAFLSVAEAPTNTEISVTFHDPEQTMATLNALKAEITYFADDLEVTI